MEAKGHAGGRCLSAATTRSSTRGRHGLRREEPATGERVARVLIGEGEREAVPVIARAARAGETGQRLRDT